MTAGMDSAQSEPIDSNHNHGVTSMNRNPSMTISPLKPCGILPPVGTRRAVFNTVWSAGRKAFPSIHGMTCIDAGRAYFQADGDATYYSVAITSDEAVMLGYPVLS